MDYTIRAIKETEYPLLEDFLYEAIFVPDGVEPPPKSIVDAPELQVYISGFGSEPHDAALIAEVDNKAVGAVWVRIMNDYGHIDSETPSFAISLYREYRGLGIGTENTLDYDRWDETVKQEDWMRTYFEGFERLKDLRRNKKSFQVFLIY